MTAAADQTRLSIIVPTLNEAGTIESALTQLQPFRERGHELILVDGHSSDATVSLARPLVDKVVQSPTGRARQMHNGAIAANGEVLWFLHADSCVPAQSDDLIIAALNVSGNHWGRFDITLMDDSLPLRAVAWLMNRRSRLTGIATGDQGIFVTRRLYEHVGGFPQIPLMEDIRLSRLLKKHGRPACIGSRLGTSARRWQLHGITRTILTMWGLRLAHFAGISPQRLARYYPVSNE